MVVVNDSNQQILSEYLSKLKRHNLDKRLIINIVQTYDSPAANWHKQWLCSDHPIISCLFSSNGELQAVIEGNSVYSLESLEESLKGGKVNIDFGYRPLFERELDNATRIDLLNRILQCKIRGEQGLNVEKDINATLETARYPYNVYLKLLSEKSQKNPDSVIHWANEMLSFDNKVYYQKVYPDLFEYAMLEIDSNYNTDKLPVMSISESVVTLADCRVSQPILFHITVTNESINDLVIKSIEAGCKCVKVLSVNIPVIKPGMSYELHFEFTPDTEGELMQKVNILSNAQNKIEIELKLQEKSTTLKRVST